MNNPHGNNAVYTGINENPSAQMNHNSYHYYNNGAPAMNNWAQSYNSNAVFYDMNVPNIHHGYPQNYSINKDKISI